MPDESGLFKFEDCLLKHYVRKEVWLKSCKRRLEAIRAKSKDRTKARRLKYFTFCAVGALDVLTLDFERVIRRSKDTRKFDTVYFFDATADHVIETQKRIPGAIGFANDFVDAVLIDDPTENLIINNPAPLEAPTQSLDTFEVRRVQRLRQTKQDFIRSFPFDVINLDLETYLFKPKEGVPGRVVNALRKVFEWQRQKGKLANGDDYLVSDFTLMFTTRVGPSNLSAEYMEMLRGYLEANLSRDQTLEPLFLRRSGNRDTKIFLAEDFDAFFRLAVPKTLASLLWEQDWQIEKSSGIRAYAFQRDAKTPYEMLHFVMDVRRINPPREMRAPEQMPPAAREDYNAVVHGIFAHDPLNVHELIKALESELKTHLEKVKIHREKVQE